MATSKPLKKSRRLLQTHNNNPWLLARNLFGVFLLSLVTTVALLKFFIFVQQPFNKYAMSSSSSKIIVYGGITWCQEHMLQCNMPDRFYNIFFINHIGRGALGSAIIKHFKAKNYVSIYLEMTCTFFLKFLC